ncbi:hypothetical protein [Ornithinicoccus hortensis]|uniref:Uncharacterized protein n=1 Tax=Ornithinicoccus hortensis TaxID=82346 RepID=A0A542YUA2_9MICO|nr:hypothetical protein [Ornithinicoccus hortensis]TQL51666.1 hypothetical protein FB467_2817 [Ornithinicoccus hortensis]
MGQVALDRTDTVAYHLDFDAGADTVLRSLTLGYAVCLLEQLTG